MLSLSPKNLFLIVLGLPCILPSSSTERHNHTNKSLTVSFEQSIIFSLSGNPVEIILFPIIIPQETDKKHPIARFPTKDGRKI
jgi:hypothetical protein